VWPGVPPAVREWRARGINECICGPGVWARAREGLQGTTLLPFTCHRGVINS